MEREDIRIRVAGIYVENDKILLVKHTRFGKSYYLLPGGGQHTGETAAQALMREWDEELGLDITPGKFLFMGESIPDDVNNRRHVYQVVFDVEKISGDLKFTPDETLTGYEWLPLEKLSDVTLYPLCLPQIIASVSDKEKALYKAYEWRD